MRQLLWVSTDLCGHSVQRWLGTIDVDMKVVVTPKSGVSVDGEEVGGIGEGWWRQHECPVC